LTEKKIFEEYSLAAFYRCVFLFLIESSILRMLFISLKFIILNFSNS